MTTTRLKGPKFWDLHECWRQKGSFIQNMFVIVLGFNCEPFCFVQGILLAVLGMQLV